ncbi:unnamed protein product [Discosporangium mesarthrocarpum]
MVGLGATSFDQTMAQVTLEAGAGMGGVGMVGGHASGHMETNDGLGSESNRAWMDMFQDLTMQQAQQQAAQLHGGGALSSLLHGLNNLDNGDTLVQPTRNNINFFDEIPPALARRDRNFPNTNAMNLEYVEFANFNELLTFFSRTLTERCNTSQDDPNMGVVPNYTLET